MSDPVRYALNHEARRLLIEALWHSSEPLTLDRFHREYVHEVWPTLPMVIYHVEQLERDGIVELEGSNVAEKRFFVLGGPNSAG